MNYYPVETTRGTEYLSLPEIRARVAVRPPATLKSEKPDFSRFFVPAHHNFVTVLFTVIVLWPIGVAFAGILGAATLLDAVRRR